MSELGTVYAIDVDGVPSYLARGRDAENAIRVAHWLMEANQGAVGMGRLTARPPVPAERAVWDRTDVMSPKSEAQYAVIPIGGIDRGTDS